LSKEKRKRQALKVTSSLAFVNDRLPKLIDQLKPCYETESKAVTSSVVQFSSKSKVNAPMVENSELVALRDRLDAVAIELSEIINELKKVA
jgi:hypothetical protein